MPERFDDHCWLTVNGKGWAIQRVEWPIMYLWRGYEPTLEFTELDVSDVDWESYCDAAVALLPTG